MKLTPIDSPRIAPVLGAKTVSSEAARSAAMAKFNEGTTVPLTTGQSPSTPGAVLDPANQPLPQSLNTEEPPPPTEAAPTEDLEAKRISAHYANLARKEKILRMKEAQFRARVNAATQPPQATPPTQPSFDASKYIDKDTLISDPFGVLNNLGLSYEQLTQKALEAPSAEDLEQRRQIAQLKSELAAIKESQQKTEKSFEENQTMARRQAELQIRQDVNRLISQDPSYAVLAAQRASGEVVRLITSVYDHGMGPEYPRGTILDIADAATMVENELTERALRVAKLQKVQQRLNSNQTAQKPETQQQPAQNTLRTLTNSVGTSTKKLTPRERALLAFRGEVA